MTLLIAAPAALGVARSSSRFAGTVFLLFLAPIVIPSIVMAVGLFYLFAQLGLVATDLGITIGHTVTGIPLAFVILLAVLRSHDWRLNQAAATLGANRPRVFLRITMPLIKGGLFAAFIFAFLNSFEELTVAIFIGGGLKTTLPRQMWDDVLLQVNPTLGGGFAGGAAGRDHAVPDSGVFSPARAVSVTAASSAASAAPSGCAGRRRSPSARTV